MKYFFKLNIISMLYALIVFIPFELMLNVYRISRLTEWSIGTVNILTSIVLLAAFIGGTMLIYSLTQKWLDQRKANLIAAILWLPYFVLFVFAFAFLFPITYGGDDPNPVIGLLAMGGMLCYPFYILLLNSIAMWKDEEIAD
ncbi:glucan phosphoethanolaminetransferase (alkaline phosphatase superfamily) [Planomicrobium stackebrandtii]|uniref:Glucan phosphoethanolaminetransferase (Alkaline phosphatase superfamily) n=1 Tax=Planomicrobium stackebrandtii TaxID=253160 RepID=A0ABU0GY40_9BACL|nr:hypothetical protein [Planomicrobium stackebrandtii]MDQ0429457.1 glucan phosphoethanolaminetransferase (alkaline phosphatase superfamily) [Planomicrobium stackebrandtii]